MWIHIFTRTYKNDIFVNLLNFLIFIQLRDRLEISLLLSLCSYVLFFYFFNIDFYLQFIYFHQLIYCYSKSNWKLSNDILFFVSLDDDDLWFNHVLFNDCIVQIPWPQQWRRRFLTNSKYNEHLWKWQQK